MDSFESSPSGRLPFNESHDGVKVCCGSSPARETQHTRKLLALGQWDSMGPDGLCARTSWRRRQYVANVHRDTHSNRSVIHRHAGRDASAAYNEIHAPSLIGNELGATKNMGDFDKSSASPDSTIFVSPESPAAPSDPTAERKGRRPLQTIISSHDFEEAASENLSAKAWAFFSSAATNCVTKKANEAYFDRIWLRPRIMRNVKDISYKTKMLGSEIGMPLFASPTAMAKLTHPDGELMIAKGCSTFHIPQTVCMTTSYLGVADKTFSDLHERVLPCLRDHCSSQRPLLLPTLRQQRPRSIGKTARAGGEVRCQRCLCHGGPAYSRKTRSRRASEGRCRRIDTNPNWRSGAE